MSTARTTDRLIDALDRDAQLERYQEQGYAHLVGVLPQELLDRCQNLLEQWADTMYAKWENEGLITDSHPELPFRERFKTVWQEAGKPHHNRSPRHELVDLDPKSMFEVLRHPALLDVAELLIESDEIITHGIWNSRPKAPQSSFTDTPWHQDAQYFTEQAKIHTMSVWFPLHDVSDQESCLAVSPGAHKMELQDIWEDDYSKFLGINPETSKDLPEKPIEMKAGDVLCFSQLMPHRAMPNKSDLMRWSMDLRFVAGRDENPGAMEHGMIARSLDPGRLTSYEDWLAKWKPGQAY